MKNLKQVLDEELGMMPLDTRARIDAAVASVLATERERCAASHDVPEIHDFAVGVVREAAHQRVRWGERHDAEKQHEDWFWLFGYLAGKALCSAKAGDVDKALHHTVTAAARWRSGTRGCSPRSSKHHASCERRVVVEGRGSSRPKLLKH